MIDYNDGTYWTTANYEEIKIADMETSHIENCIAMLDRKGVFCEGSIGYDGKEVDYDEILCKDTPIYHALKKELDRRERSTNMNKGGADE